MCQTKTNSVSVGYFQTEKQKLTLTLVHSKKKERKRERKIEIKLLSYFVNGKFSKGKKGNTYFNLLNIWRHFDKDSLDLAASLKSLSLFLLLANNCSDKSVVSKICKLS